MFSIVGVSASLTDDLMLWLPFNNTITDYSGNSYYSYQEQADSFGSSNNVTDGDWTTYNIPSTTFYMNYTKLSNVVNATWKIGVYTNAYYNSTIAIPSECWDYSETQLQLSLIDGGSTNNYRCWNGSWYTWLTSITSFPNPNAQFVEEGITWEYNVQTNYYGNSATSYCYQETATVSNDCGALDTGNYIADESVGGFTDATLIWDGDFDTGARLTGGTSASVYFNYSKPANAIRGTSFLKIKSDVIGLVNKTISNSCWNQEPLQFQVRIYVSDNVHWDCYNGTDWEVIQWNSFGGATYIYEEAMYWDIPVINYCFQETANISTICGGLDTGEYNVIITNADHGFDYYVNYTIPANVVDAIIQVRTSYFGSATNYTTNLDECILNSQNGILELNFSNPGSGDSYFYCKNNTDWILFYSNNGLLSCIASEASIDYMYDEDYDTGIIRFNGAYRSPTSGTCNGAIYEESIYWIKSIANYTFDKNSIDNNALGLNGVDEYVTTELEINTTNDWSTSLWYYSDTNTIPLMGQNGTTGSIDDYFFRMNPGSFLHRVGGSQVGVTLDDYNSTWVNLLCKQTSLNISCYQNGIYKASITNSLNSVLMNLTVGSDYYGFMNGTIDEVRVYNRSLEDWEISNLYYVYDTPESSVVSNISSYTSSNVDFLVDINYTGFTGTTTCGLTTNNVNVTCNYVTGSVGVAIVTCDIPSSISSVVTFQAYCNDSTIILYEDASNVSIDTVRPSITITFPVAGNTTKTNTNFSLNVTINDLTNDYAYVNITNPSSVNVFSELYDTSGSTSYNIVNATNNSDAGVYIIRIDAYDINGLSTTQYVTYEFLTGNYTTSAISDSVLYTNHPHYFSINITYNTILYDDLLDVKLDYNGTNYTPTLVSEGTGYKFYNYSLIPTEVNTDFATVNSKWWFKLDHYILGELQLNTTAVTHTEYNIELGACAGYIDEEILNVSFWDEQTNTSIEANYSFIGAGWDGEAYQNFTLIDEGASVLICSNIPPALTTYAWEYVGDINVNSVYNNVSYVPRVFSFSVGADFLMNNNPYVNTPLFLIGVENSSTVTYTWITYQSNPIDGDLQVYMCNVDGSKSLVESIPIVSGQAVANLELYTQQYSYTVVIDGETYTEPSGWSRCHVESSTDLSYSVDIIPDTATPALGLSFVDCKITKQSNNTVTMTFGSSGASDDPITGCIIAFRDTIYNKTEIYRNCTTSISDSTTITRLIPDNDNSYYVTGQVIQNGNLGQCKDTISFFIDSNDRELIGIEGLIFVALLIMAIALIYAGDGILQLSGAGVGLIASYILGILILDWIVVTSMLTILVAVAMVGRANRR